MRDKHEAQETLIGYRIGGDYSFDGSDGCRIRAERRQRQSIEGAWRTVVTPRNCQTGEPITSLRGQFTFHQGGTMAEYGIGPGSSPALRSPGHGVWRRRHGWQLYSFAFTFNRYNSSGVFIGAQRITGDLELGAGGDTFATRSVIEILDVNDVIVGSGCATAAGTRFE